MKQLNKHEIPTKYVDEKTLEITYNLLKGMQISEPDINTIIYLFVTACDKYYKSGYIAGQKS